MGNIISENGLRPDPDKIRTILDMPPPEDKAGVQRLLGTVNFLAQYIPNMSEITAPLRNCYARIITSYETMNKSSHYNK